MSQLFEYIDSLPELPEVLVKEIRDTVILNSNAFRFTDYKDYRIYPIRDIALKRYLQSLFPEDYYFMVQVIGKNINIHKDIGRTSTFNYIIDAGGDNVETCFYNNKKNLIEKHIIKEHRWHRLDVTAFHDVKNVKNKRIALTVYKIAYTDNQF